MIDEYMQGIKDLECALIGKPVYQLKTIVNELMNKRNERKLKMTKRCKTCGRKLKGRTEQIINNINKAFKNDTGNGEKQIALALVVLPIYKEHLVNVHESSMGGKVYHSPVFFTAKEVKDMVDTSDIQSLVNGRYAFKEDNNFIIASALEQKLIERFELYGV